MIPADLRQALRNPWWLAAGLLALVALTATAALGGFRQAAPAGKALPPLSPGQRYDNGAFAVTPLRAWLADSAPGQPRQPWKHADYLVLQVTLENLAERSYSGYGYPLHDLVLLDSQQQPLRAEAAYYAEDHLVLDRLGPRLPIRADFVWDRRTAVSGL